VRVEQLDNLVWQQVWQLLNEPQLIEQEIERRLQEHQQSSPVEQRKANLTRERTRLGEQTDKLIDAYQEGLIDLAQLRNRVPEVKKRQTALERELESLNLQALEHNQLVGINASVAKFIAQLQKSAETLDVEQKQRIVRLLVRQVVVGAESITIHHCIPLPGARDRIGGGVIDCGQAVPPSQGR
jgi:site-specific DNA recombinase